jgi:nucleoside phosphorylase
MFSHVKDSHGFYFDDRSDSVADIFDDPIRKIYPTTVLLDQGLGAWSNNEIYSEEGRRTGGLVASGLQLRRGEAITRDFFIKTSGLPDEDPQIDQIALEIQRRYLGIYLLELRGLLITGLKGCGSLDLSFPYCPFYDYQVMSYSLSAIFGRALWQDADSLLLSAAEMRLTAAQVHFSDTFTELVSTLTRRELESSTPLSSLQQLRRRVLSRLALALPRQEDHLLAGPITSPALAHASEVLLIALARAQSGRYEESTTLNLSIAPGLKLHEASRPLDELSSYIEPSAGPLGQYDVGVLTVIGPELISLLEVLDLDVVTNRQVDEYGGLFWAGRVHSVLLSAQISVVVHCIGTAGQASAAGATERLIAFGRPRLILLVGIAAGRIGKCHIGDIIIPTTIVDYTSQVMTARGASMRPKVPTLSYSVVQMIRPWAPSPNDLRRRSEDLWPDISDLRPAPDLLPVVHEAAIASGDLLLRDETWLDGLAARLSENIRAGEMEASGVVRACESRATPIPWFVVRGISDYGDAGKNDNYQVYASRMAATYGLMFLQHAFDYRTLPTRR